MRTEKEQAGFEYASGAFALLSLLIVIGFITIYTYGVIANSLEWGLDDSDKDGWHRSGLTIHTDYKTGIEYLSDGHGGMVVRGK